MNNVSHFIHLKNIKKKILDAMKSTKIKRRFLLKHHGVFASYMHDEIVKPDVGKDGCHN